MVGGSVLVIPEDQAQASELNSRGTASMGFVRLVTNLEGLTATERALVRESDAPYLQRTLDYLRYVREGNQGKPYCPFVEFIERENGYRAREFPQSPQNLSPFYLGDLMENFLDGEDQEFLRLDIGYIPLSLEEKFHQLSPQKTRAGQRSDPTVTIAAFSHPDAMSAEFCAELDKARDNRRQDFLDQGLMLSQMHPHHPLGSLIATSPHQDRPLYGARIPLLIVRRMHEVDKVFMKTPQAQAAYDRLFPTTSQHSLGGKNAQPLG